MMEEVLNAPSGFLIARRGIFTPAELNAIEALGDSLAPRKAELAGRNDNTDHLRITRVAWMERNAQTRWLFERVEQTVLDLNARFYKYDLYGLVEDLQYTVYYGDEGGHYSWHVDTGPTNLQPRKISLTLQLSEPSGYDGGELILQAGEGPSQAQKMRGTLVTFPSYVMHRVTPVTAGIRKSLVAWVAGPKFR